MWRQHFEAASAAASGVPVYRPITPEDEPFTAIPEKEGEHTPLANLSHNGSTVRLLSAEDDSSQLWVSGCSLHLLRSPTYIPKMLKDPDAWPMADLYLM